MKKYGLIGYPITHSFSPGYFAEKFEREGITDAIYGLFPLLDIGEFNQLSGLSGLNVTIPYKEEIIPFLDRLSDEARQVGAVNTIRFQNGRKIGYNTDVYGFRESLIHLWEETKPERALVLGTGGAARAVWYVLDKLGISFSRVSRSKGDMSYQDIDTSIIEANQLIINTTPLGMSPNTDTCPDIPYHALTESHILYDLIYNPEKTLFLIKGAMHGATVKGGLEMLQLQAEKSWQIWNLP